MYEGPLKWAPARKQMHTRRASAYTETGWAGECVEHSAGTASREHWAMEAVKRHHAQAGTPTPPAAESTLRPSPARRALCRTTDRQRQAAIGGTMLRLDTCPHSGPSPQAGSAPAAHAIPPRLRRSNRKPPRRQIAQCVHLLSAGWDFSNFNAFKPFLSFLKTCYHIL